MRATVLYYAKQSVKQPLLYTVGITTAVIGYTHIGFELAV